MCELVIYTSFTSQGYEELKWLVKGDPLRSRFDMQHLAPSRKEADLFWPPVSSIRDRIINTRVSNTAHSNPAKKSAVIILHLEEIT